MSHQECPDPVNGAVVRELTMGHGDDHQGPRGETGMSSAEAHAKTPEATAGEVREAVVGFGEGSLGHPWRRKPATCPNEACVNHKRWYAGCTILVMNDDWEWVPGWHRCVRCQTIFEHHFKAWDDIHDKQERI